MTETKNGAREALARKQGYRRGLKVAYDMTKSAKQHQALRARCFRKAEDIDMREEYEHGASVLHALMAKMREEIEKAGD